MSIVITGGICTGKSTVCKILKDKGFFIIDADKIAHRVLNENIKEIEKIFGKQYIKNDEVDRKKLGNLVFSNPLKKKLLEALLHPKIQNIIKSLEKQYKKEKKRYLIDIPLFYETNSYKADKVIVVYAPEDIELKRLIKRDNISKEEAKQRIKSQLDIEKKKILGDFVIDNSKDLKFLKKEIFKIIKFIGE